MGSHCCEHLPVSYTHLDVYKRQKLPFPGGKSAAIPAPDGILPLDFNYDFKTDLVLVGAGGVRFYQQNKADLFTNVTAATKLPATLVNAPYTGAWAVDIEADGDLDIVLGQASGLPAVSYTHLDVYKRQGVNSSTPLPARMK